MTSEGKQREEKKEERKGQGQERECKWKRQEKGKVRTGTREGK